MLLSSSDSAEACFLPKWTLLIWKFKMHPAQRPTSVTSCSARTGTNCFVVFLVFNAFCFSSVDSCYWISFFPFISFDKRGGVKHLTSLCLYCKVQLLTDKHFIYFSFLFFFLILSPPPPNKKFTSIETLLHRKRGQSQYVGRFQEQWKPTLDQFLLSSFSYTLFRS